MARDWHVYSVQPLVTGCILQSHGVGAFCTSSVRTVVGDDWEFLGVGEKYSRRHRRRRQRIKKNFSVDFSAFRISAINFRKYYR